MAHSNKNKKKITNEFSILVDLMIFQVDFFCEQFHSMRKYDFAIYLLVIRNTNVI